MTPNLIVLTSGTFCPAKIDLAIERHERGVDSRTITLDTDQYSWTDDSEGGAPAQVAL